MRTRQLYQYPARFFDKIEKFEFLGEKYFVPSPPQEYLTYQYGEDWHVPKNLLTQRNIFKVEFSLLKLC